MKTTEMLWKNRKRQQGNRLVIKYLDKYAGYRVDIVDCTYCLSGRYRCHCSGGCTGNVEHYDCRGSCEKGFYGRYCQKGIIVFESFQGISVLTLKTSLTSGFYGFRLEIPLVFC